MTKPSFRALNQPRLLLGVCPSLLCGSFLGAALVFNVTANFYAGALLGGLLYLFSRWATALDDRIDQVFLKTLRVKPYYDPLQVGQERFTRGEAQ